jgi:guanidinoacetate N-methyltransferase
MDFITAKKDIEEFIKKITQYDYDEYNLKKELLKHRKAITFMCTDITLAKIDFIKNIAPALKTIFPAEDKTDWKDVKPKYKKEKLEICGRSVMESWERPYMKALADIATKYGGDILEVGYGMGISANYIQKHDIQMHVVIEANTGVCKKAERDFCRLGKQNKVRIINNLWQNAVKKIRDSSFDGILFDAYIINIEEIEELGTTSFFNEAYRLLKKRGVFTYYSHQTKDFSKFDINLLKKSGFNKFSGKIIKVKPPEDCEYYSESTMFAPIVEKI